MSSKKIIEFVTGPCFQQLKGAYSTVLGVITAFRTIIANAHKSALGWPGFIADYILGMVCNWEQFVDAYNYALAASTTKDNSERFYFWGIAIGNGLTQIANQERRRFVRRMVRRMKKLSLFRSLYVRKSISSLQRIQRKF